MSANGEWIAFASGERGVSIWKVKNEALLVLPKREGRSIRNLAWASNLGTLLYSYSDNTVWIRDIPSGKARQIFRGSKGRIDALAWSSDAAFIAAGSWDADKYANARRNTEEPQHEILLWDVKKEKVVAKVASHFGYINHIAWMPDQPVLAFMVVNS